MFSNEACDEEDGNVGEGKDRGEEEADEGEGENRGEEEDDEEVEGRLEEKEESASCEACEEEEAYCEEEEGESIVFLNTISSSSFVFTSSITILLAVARALSPAESSVPFIAVARALSQKRLPFIAVARAVSQKWLPTLVGGRMCGVVRLAWPIFCASTSVHVDCTPITSPRMRQCARMCASLVVPRLSLERDGRMCGIVIAASSAR